MTKTKKFLAIVLCLLMTFTLLPTSALADDVDLNTFYINSAADLEALAVLVAAGTDPIENGRSGKTYILTTNIDLKDYEDWTPIGSMSGYKAFMGVFDGGGYTVSGLKISGNDSHAGLFGYVKGASVDKKAQIKNLTVKDADVSGGDYVGAVVGRYGNSYELENYIEPLENCAMVDGSVTGSGLSAGGVVGVSYGEVRNCHSTGSIKGSGAYVGGVVGDAYKAVSCCYATGSVENTDINTGGVVGRSTSSVTNCYATGSVRGIVNQVGGVVGYVKGAVSYCYATGSVSTDINCSGGILGNAGGVVGRIEGTGSTVTNCVALGHAMSGYENVGRVVGLNGAGCTISNCYAWDGTTVEEHDSPAAIVSDAAKGAETKHGADLQFNEDLGLFYNGDSPFGWTSSDPSQQFSEDVWELRSGQKNLLPKLKNTPDNPQFSLPAEPSTPSQPSAPITGGPVESGSSTTNDSNTTSNTVSNSNTGTVSGDTTISTVNDGLLTAIVTANRLNVRSGAGISFDRIGQLVKGETVKVYLIANGWAKIVYGNGVGYVNAKYLSFLNSGSLYTGKVLCRNLNVRQIPTIISTTKGRLTRNTVVTLDTVENGWGRLSIAHGKLAGCWVRMDYIN